MSRSWDTRSPLRGEKEPSKAADPIVKASAPAASRSRMRAGGFTLPATRRGPGEGIVRHAAPGQAVEDPLAPRAAQQAVPPDLDGRPRGAETRLRGGADDLQVRGAAGPLDALGGAPEHPGVHPDVLEAEG